MKTTDIIIIGIVALLAVLVIVVIILYIKDQKEQKIWERFNNKESVRKVINKILENEEIAWIDRDDCKSQEHIVNANVVRDLLKLYEEGDL